MIDSARRQRPMAGGDEAEAALTNVATPEQEQPDHALTEFERRRGLQRAPEQLPDEQRTAVLLPVEHEWRPGEMSAVTGVRRETVKSLRRISRHCFQNARPTRCGQ